MLKCWSELPGYKQFVGEKWTSFKVVGWGGFVLQVKLKMIKVVLKEWHYRHCRNLPGRIQALKKRVSKLDVKGEGAALSDDELTELRGSSFELHSLTRMNTGICLQQSRLLWLQEGDPNSKYFHSIVAGRRQGNSISSLMSTV